MAKKNIAATPASQSAYIIIGSIHHINGIEKKSGHTFFIYLELPPVLFYTRQNSIYLESTQLQEKLSYTIRSFDGHIHAQGRIAYNELFQGLLFNTRALEILNKESVFFKEEEALALVPLFYISHAGTAGERDGDVSKPLTDVTLYSQLRYSETDIIFIRTGFLDEWRPGMKPLLENCIRLHDQNSLFLGNHQCYYRKIKSEYEIEYKMNLEYPVKIWELTCDIYSRIKSGQLTGYIPEYKDEFQKWDYMNYLYEVTAPESEVGYISFITMTTGNYNVKRKIYKKDDLMRKEFIKKNEKIKGSFEEYLDQNYNFQYKKYPPFRRVRYDVNFESLATGNVFGIFFDHVSMEGRPECLMQCEIEYLRTRSLCDNDRHMHELNHIHDWTIAYLNEKNIKFTRTFYSKLTFLKDLFK